MEYMEDKLINEIKLLTFNEAIDLLKSGKKLLRGDCKGYIYFEDGIFRKVIYNLSSFQPLSYFPIIEEYFFSSEDILAKDWIVYEDYILTIT